jgi:hypothetical protein
MSNLVSWRAVSIMALALTMATNLSAAVGAKSTLPIYPMAEQSTPPATPPGVTGSVAPRPSLYILLEEPGQTAYEKLRNLYNNGTKVDLADINGWYGGRIVMQATPTVFNGALLIAESVSDDGGPISNGRFVMMGFTHSAPNFFDALSPSVVTEARTLFRSIADHLGDPKQTEDGVQYTYHNSLGLHRYFIKKNGQYLVQKCVYPTDSVQYAYYFKKLDMPGGNQ